MNVKCFDVTLTTRNILVHNFSVPTFLSDSGTSYGLMGLYNVGCGGSEALLSSCPSSSSGSCADVDSRAGVLCVSDGNCQATVLYVIC